MESTLKTMVKEKGSLGRLYYSFREKLLYKRLFHFGIVLNRQLSELPSAHDAELLIISGSQRIAEIYQSQEFGVSFYEIILFLREFIGWKIARIRIAPESVMAQ